MIHNMTFRYLQCRPAQFIIELQTGSTSILPLCLKCKISVSVVLTTSALGPYTYICPEL